MKRISKLSLLLPLALFSGAVVIDLNIMSGAVVQDQVRSMRELFVILAFALSVPLIYSQKWASDRNVLRGLRSLFFLILFTYLALSVSLTRLQTLRAQVDDGGSIYTTIPDYWFILSWSFFSAVFVLLSLGTLRNLIFIKQKKPTARNFNLLMFFLFLYSILPQLKNYYHIEPFVSGGKYLDTIILFILINFMVINTFRVSWINYLNKRQKVAGFWGVLFLIPIQIHLNIRFHELNPAELFSPSLGAFVNYSIVFVTIYVIFTFLALIAHLPTAKLYDRKMSQISSMLRLSRTISSEFELNKLVLTIVRLTAEVTEADFGWLELVDPKTREIKLVSSIHLSKKEKESRKPDFAEPHIEWVGKHQEPYLCNQVDKSHVLQSLRKWKRDLNSVIIVPLITSGRIIGLLYSGSRMEFVFEQDDIDMLKAFCEQAVVAIENARLIEASIVKERLEQELKIAHDAQMKLLPKSMPEVADFELDAICKTANEVGGDYYDFFHLSHNKLGVVVGDVSGKGPSAAFYMAELKGIMGALAQKHHSPKRLLISANDILYQNIDRKTFVSLIYGIIDTEKKRFTFCRAGHCPILLTREGQDTFEMLEPRGLGLGLDKGTIFERSLEEQSISLKPGTLLLLYTDGATEARNKLGDEFGEDRLAQSFVKHNQQSLNNLMAKIVGDIDAFVGGEKAHDDMTCVLIKAK